MVNIKKYSGGGVLTYIKRMKNNLVFFIIFIIITIVTVVLVKRYRYKHKYEPILISKSRNIKPLIIPNKKLIKSEEGIQFAYSFWIFMDSVSGSGNWNSNYYDERNIMRKDNAPGIYYTPETNLFRIGIRTRTDEENIEMFDIKNIKLQEWVHFVVSLNNRTLDVFIDGELKHSFITENVPILNDNALIVGSIKTKVNGRLTNLRYFNNSLDKKKVKTLYNNGKNKSIPNPSVFWWIFT